MFLANVVLLAALSLSQRTGGSSMKGACDVDAARARTIDAERAATPSEQSRLAREAIALCYSHAPAHNALGTALEAMRDYDGATREYKRAIALDPSWYLPLLGLGDVSREEGRLDTARASYEQAIAIAKTVVERDEARAALSRLPNTSPSSMADFQFKTSDVISRGLRVGKAAASPGASGEEVGSPSSAQSQDFYQSAAGYAANFSILFEVNSATVLPEGMLQLDELGKALRAAGPNETYVIEGHASSEGSAVFNRSLSRERATNVAEYLVRRFGLRSSQLQAVGKGSDAPVVENGVENHIKSRRVTVVRRYDQ